MNTLELWRTDRTAPFSLFRNLSNFSREIDGLFNEGDKPWLFERKFSKDSITMPACDIHEDEKNFYLSLELAGYLTKDISVEIVKNKLIVSGKRTQLKYPNAQAHHVERSFGEFTRTFSLPENFKSEPIDAHFEDGVLYLAIPKSEVEQSRKIEIREGKSIPAKTIVSVKSTDESKAKATV